MHLRDVSKSSLKVPVSGNKVWRRAWSTGIYIEKHVLAKPSFLYWPHLCLSGTSTLTARR